MEPLKEIKQRILEFVEQKEYVRPEELLESLPDQDPRQVSMALHALEEEFAPVSYTHLAKRES